MAWVGPHAPQPTPEFSKKKKKKTVFDACLTEKLGGSVTDDWSKATYLVGDDVQSRRAQEALADDMLLFSSNFLVQSMAQERIVNAGPFILHQTVVRDEARPDEDVEAAPVAQSGKRGRGAARGEEELSSEMGDLVAELEDISSPEQARPKRAAAIAARAAMSPAQPPSSAAKSPKRAAMSPSRPPTSATKSAVKKPSPPKSGRKKKLLPVRQSPQSAKAAKGKRGDRRLGIDTSNERELEELMGEFEDFEPNKNGALVSAVEHSRRK